MRSRLVINLLLLAFIIGVTTFLLVTDTNETETAPQPVSELTPDQITEIVIERKGKDSVRFSKQNELWVMQAPYQINANQQRITTILNLLTANSADQLNAHETDLTRLLLDDPELILKLNNEVFAFGDVNPLDKKRYILYADKIHLVHDNLQPQLTTSPVFFIDTKVLPVTSEPVVVQYPQFRLLKQDDTWMLESELDISEEKVQILASTWKDLRASSVQKYVPLEALYEISVEFADGEIIAYAVTSDLPTLILARPDLNLQYEIPDYLSEKLFPREDSDDPGAE